MGASKIQHEGARDDSHLDHLQIIVGTDKLGNVEPQHFGDVGTTQ